VSLIINPQITSVYGLKETRQSEQTKYIGLH